MFADERLATYIHSLSQGNTEFLDSLEAAARDGKVPVIRGEMQSFLRVLLELKKPERILEVGTAVGFSALFMAEYTSETCRITTIEKEQGRILAARENFSRALKGGKITLLEGDAGEILKTLKGRFDLIFMDAAKGQYLSFLPDVCRLLAPGGVLLSDNVLQDGDLLESRFVVERRNRTIYHRMREYLFALTHTDGLLTSIVPVGDGAAVTIKLSDFEKPYGAGEEEPHGKADR